MAWIESHQSLAGHPKTRRAARLLDVSIPTMMGHLHCLWHWALDYAQDGKLAHFTMEELADAAMWEGDPAQFVAALVNCRYGDKHGFIEDTPDGLVIHDWWDFAGKLIDRRDRDAERKRSGWTKDAVDPSSGHPTDGVRTAYAQYPTNQPTEPTEPTEEDARPAPKAPRASRDGDWVGCWVDSERSQGREPGKGQKATFGRKVNEIRAKEPIDEWLMTDAINRMSEQEKAPGVLPYVYSDCKRDADKEAFRVATTVRRVR